MISDNRVAKVEIKDLCKRYGSVTAFAQSDLVIHDGEFFTLLGPSGSGKTTLLQMISGLVQPTSGHVIIDAHDETQTPVHKRDIGLVFQHYALFPHLTVEENIAFPLEMRGASKEEKGRRVRDTLDLVQLYEMNKRFPHELSGGQQQRVALARCFVYEPAVILMDEPLGALDRKLREHLQIEIKQLHRKTRATIIYVTHDQEEALAMSDRICLMNNATIAQVGSPKEIYHKPASRFVADFIGISNVIEGRVMRHNGKIGLQTKSGFFTIPKSDVTEGTDAALVVRPEALSFNGPGENRVEATVTETIFAGAEVKVLADTDHLSGLAIRVAGSQTPPAEGATMQVAWKAADSVLVTE